MRKRNSNIMLILHVLFIIVVFGAVIAWWVFWFNNCTSGTVADAPAVCLIAR